MLYDGLAPWVACQQVKSRRLGAGPFRIGLCRNPRGRLRAAIISRDTQLRRVVCRLATTDWPPPSPSP